jgi:hypothetical protein
MLLLLFNDRIPPMKVFEKVAAQCMKIACLVAAQGAGKMPPTAVEARVPPGRYVKNIDAPLATQEAGKTPPNVSGSWAGLCGGVHKAGGPSNYLGGRQCLQEQWVLGHPLQRCAGSWQSQLMGVLKT